MNPLTHVRRAPATTAFALALLGCALATGCSSDAPPPSLVTTRDSAGVEIVDNGPIATAAPLRLCLGDPALAVIGRDEGAAGHMLNQVVGAFRLEGGGLVVGDRGSAEVRYFDADGAHRLTVGGQGEGPDEFRLLVAVDRLPGDTVVAGAWPLGLRVWWNDQGEFLRNTESGRWGYGLVGGRTLPDGTFLIDTYGDASYGNSIEMWAAFGEGSTFRTEGTLLRVSRDGEPLDTIGTVVGEEWFKVGEPRSASFANRVRPFSYRTHLAFNDAQLFLGENHLGEVRVHGYDGTLRRIVRWTPEPLPVTAEDRRRFRETVLSSLNNPARRPSFERWLAEVEYPETKPAFQTLATDRQGRLWVQTWTEDEDVHRWLVFERSGRLAATLEAAGDLRVLDAGEGYVVAVATDAFGVETVRMFELLEG